VTVACDPTSGSSTGCALRVAYGLTDRIEEHADEHVTDDDVDAERLRVCAYWRCGVLFEQRSANQRFCRKACRSRQAKWQRAQERAA
jgi:predicted RNA-binding Zn ribbon-like protein